MNSTRLIPLKTKSSNILIEVDRNDTDSIEGAGASGVTKAINDTIDGAVGKINEIAQSLAALELPKKVQTAIVELGFKFDAKGTVYVVSSTAAASIKLSLTLNFNP